MQSYGVRKATSIMCPRNYIIGVKANAYEQPSIKYQEEEVRFNVNRLIKR